MVCVYVDSGQRGKAEQREGVGIASWRVAHAGTYYTRLTTGERSSQDKKD